MISKLSTFMLLLILVLSEFNLRDSLSLPAPVDIIGALTSAQEFNIMSSLLIGSEVINELNADQRGSGITLFVANDYAFETIPDDKDIKKLSAAEKANLLKFHALHAYYSENSLKLLRNPVHPTLATENKGAGKLTLDISTVGGFTTINSGTVRVNVTRTIIDRSPVSVFVISKVLLPDEPL